MKDYPISLLCRIAGVSKSGYYKWWKNADKELSAMIDDYMYNYNYTRKQWSKNKMTPIEYKNFLLVS